MQELSALRLAGLLADSDRLRVVSALALGAETLDDVSKMAGLDQRRVVSAMERLVAAGLVEHDGQRFLLLEAAFRLAVRADSTVKGGGSQFEAEPDQQARRILDRWVVGGGLQGWPAKWSHKLVILDWIAQRFEPGIKYSESQVNMALLDLSSDTATTRRYLVDAAMLDRDGGLYWRSGGTVRDC